MFEFFPKQVADEIQDISAARIDSWATMNTHVLACIGQLVHLNLDTSRKFMADALEAMSPTAGPQSNQAPVSERYFFVPQDAAFFAVYGKEVANIFAAMQKEFLEFGQKSFGETVRDMPLLSPYAASADNAGSPFTHMRQAGQADASAAAPGKKQARTRAR